MTLSTKAERARQLNAARGLLQRHVALPQAVQRLSREFDLSERQAYRYLEEASQLDLPVEVPEPTVPITLKLPPSTVERLRKYARSSGLTIGAIVTGAVNAFLGALKKQPRPKSSPLQIHVSYSFDRLLESKLAQAYDILVPSRERPVGGRVKEFDYEDGGDLRSGLVRAAARGEHYCEPDRVADRVRQGPQSGSTRRVGLRR